MLIFRLKGDEEIVGAFDLIYKGKEIGQSTQNTYSTMLGCKPNRIENMKKLARSCAYRLSKEHLEKETALLKAQNKNEGNKFNFKKRTQVNVVEKPVSMNTVTVGVKKKVDDVNTDYIRYVQERERGKQEEREEK